MADISSEPAFAPVFAVNPWLHRVRTSLSVPMLKEGELIGAFNVFREEVRPFSEKQIALLQNFAAQAVIAMENARLLTETREALEQQTATAEVLQVINSSPGDLAPVFDIMLEKAMHLCDAPAGYLLRNEGGIHSLAAGRGISQDLARFMEHMPQPHPQEAQVQILEGAPFVHVHDLKDSEAYRSGTALRRAAVDLGGLRTGLAVPLVKDGRVLGNFCLARYDVRPFTDKQIALLQNFSAQAVIAMENARLITETREALEQQTATAEVLQVINSSPGNLTPVFEAMLEKAMRLCESSFGALRRFDGKMFWAIAVRDASGAAIEIADEPVLPDPGSASERIVQGEAVVHIPDLIDTEEYRSGVVSRLIAVEKLGARTALWVALRKDDLLVGDFVVYRQEVKPFTDKQIALLRNFAEQAVIAMENARLLTETREALEQQTATAEVLQVINSSPGDLGPVFEAMLDKALTLCGAAFGVLWQYDGESIRASAIRGASPDYLDFLTKQAYQPSEGSAHGRLVAGEDVVRLADVADSDDYRSGNPLPRALVDLGGGRSLLAVALRKEESFLGDIVIYRREVREFSDKQIALLKNFAAQAVIAMENARLITETREALEQQTATAEVLQVINSSPGELAPVFDAMLERAARLCEAAYGVLFIRNGDVFLGAATRNLPPPLEDFVREPFEPSPGGFIQRAAQGQAFEHVLDLTTEAARVSQDPRAEAVVKFGGARTMLSVALRRYDTILGAFNLYRQEVCPFSDKQIALLQNFAAQAVIAMENARLLTETREALEQQTATAEVLQVINSSPGDLAPVFDAMLGKAMRLCEANFGFLSTYDGEQFNAAALHGLPKTYVAEYLSGPYLPGPNTTHDRLVRGELVVHVPNLAIDRADSPRRRAVVEVLGVRSILAVPLRKDGVLLGAIHVYRQEVRPFSDKQIALLQNFAAQAVIAMENARLITETHEALEQQTATAEVLQVINSSPGDLAPVFDAMLEKAHTLCGAAHGSLQLYDGEKLHAVATNAVSDKFADILREGYRAADSPASRALIEGAPFAHIADCAEIDHPVFRGAAEFAGIHTVLFVPLRKDGAFLGLISAARLEVRPFSEKEIALLQNFAAQAVIAMENARLLTETREALEQQTATAEVLQVINSSPGDLAPVFNAMLEKAVRLCDAVFGTLHTFDGDIAQVAAERNLPKALSDWQGRFRPDPERSFMGRSLRQRRTIHVADDAAEEPYRTGVPSAVAAVELGGVRTLLHVPLIKGNTAVGVFTIFRQEVRPFSDKQIALLENFAAQAVIAMENARLITETREALEQQTATAEVLQVINSSPGDLAPVFEAILEKAHTLCGAAKGALTIYDGEHFRAVATRGVSEQYAALLRAPQYNPPGSPPRRLLDGESIVQIPDIATLPYPIPVAAAGREGVRTVLHIPLRKDGALLGYITAYRQEVRPFTNKQIALLQNFAAQAVIAMENARLLNEVRQRQAELRVTFDNMVDGVAMFDAELRLAAWNRNFQHLLDVPDEFLAERPPFDTYIRYLTERGEFGETDSETQIKRLRDRLGDHYSFERTRPDGTVIEVRHNPMPDGGVVLIYSDITERKRSEAEIRAARDAAEAAYRDLKAAQANLIQAEKMASLGQLTAGIAHEIKNPLNFVNNFAGLSVELLDELKETAAPAISTLDDERRTEIDETIEMLTGNLDKIAEHGRRADNIVKSMLEHSRGSSGERRTVDLNGLIEEALNLAYHGARAQDHGFNINLDRDYAAAIAPIEFVPQDITRVCLNLFTNGFYATTKRQREGADPNFKPTLRVTTRDLGDAVEVGIRDNGTGIPPEIKDKLFQPFFTTKPTGEGTGLGLSISYDIVTQQHGGTITVDSRIGGFTEFTVRLPRTYRASVAEAAS